MKVTRKVYLIVLFLLGYLGAVAQTTADLVKEGIALNDAGKYAEALDKYNQSIKIDPAYADAYYEAGYTLYTSGKKTEAIPYVEKVLVLNPKLRGAYDLLGNIYDDTHQTDKAIELYKKGIEVAPGYQRLHFNLAIAYSRQKRYAESEVCAIAAIKLDPKHISSIRVYARTCYYEQKRDCSLLAWCSLLMVEPQTQRAKEAYKFVQNILNYGITQNGDKSITVNIAGNGLDSKNLALQIAVLAATTDKKNLSPADSLALQLQAVFKTTAEQAAKQPSFFSSYFAKYFGNLAETDNMPAFARLISLTAHEEENQAWFKEHPKKYDDLKEWMRTTERSF